MEVAVGEDRAKRLAAASNGRNQQNAIAFFEEAGFATEKADIFFVEVDVEELANLALIVTDVPGESGKARSELVESFSDRGAATVHFGRAVREASEGCGDLDGDGHF
jgi:hypothetical protein